MPVTAAPPRKKHGRSASRRQQPIAKTASKSEREQQKDVILNAFLPSRLNRHNIDWASLIWITAMHVGAIAAPFFFTWTALGVAVFLHWMTLSIGICLGYHRFLSHKSMRLRAPVEFFTTLCGVLSGEGTPLAWAATHRLHHQQSDKIGDPHSPLDGPWWSHIMWLFARRTPEEQELLYSRYVPELKDRKVLRMFEKTYGLWLFGTGFVLFAIGGLPLLLWGLCARMTYAYHSTWLVNSATHLWGYRNYDTRDESRNLWWVALVSYGEGWHNNHHAHPSNARAGHKWWEIDPTYWIIKGLKATGLAYDVKDAIPTKA